MDKFRRNILSSILGIGFVSSFLNACGGGGSSSGTPECPTGQTLVNGECQDDRDPNNGGDNGGNNGGGNGGDGGNGGYGAGLTKPKPMFASPKSERVFVSNSTGEYGAYSKKSSKIS